jgi:SAM-dependent methyltransferase
MTLHRSLRPIHPFPARMAPELVWDELPDHSPQLRVLDPMAGSGTTLVTAKLRGHEAIGFDRDPLAVLIARSWLTNVPENVVEAKGKEILIKARSRARSMKLADAYPRNADDETKAFVRYWFDPTNRRQLTALADSISRLHDPSLRDLMWCAFSRLIITKKIGVSRAMDISHSRPHRSYEKAPVNAFDRFERAVKYIVNAAPFPKIKAGCPSASVDFADARHLPVADSSVDMVITSPPYLNAIDYIRGHKFSLIWMGHSIGKLRGVRATNVGTETVAKPKAGDMATAHIMGLMCPVDELSNRNAGMLRQYVWDMREILSETKRVLRPGGKAVFVVGNCNIRETFVQNSKCVEGLSAELGMVVSKVRSRPLPENRRYLPPPESLTAGKALNKRMREEVIITIQKN